MAWTERRVLKLTQEVFAAASRPDLNVKSHALVLRNKQRWCDFLTDIEKDLNVSLSQNYEELSAPPELVDRTIASVVTVVQFTKLAAIQIDRQVADDLELDGNGEIAIGLQCGQIARLRRYKVGDADWSTDFRKLVSSNLTTVVSGMLFEGQILALNELKRVWLLRLKRQDNRIPDGAVDMRHSERVELRHGCAQ